MYFGGTASQFTTIFFSKGSCLENCWLVYDLCDCLTASVSIGVFKWAHVSPFMRRDLVNDVI